MVHPPIPVPAADGSVCDSGARRVAVRNDFARIEVCGSGQRIQTERRGGGNHCCWSFWLCCCWCCVVSAINFVVVFSHCDHCKCIVLIRVGIVFAVRLSGNIVRGFRHRRLHTLRLAIADRSLALRSAGQRRVADHARATAGLSIGGRECDKSTAADAVADGKSRTIVTGTRLVFVFIVIVVIVAICRYRGIGVGRIVVLVVAVFVSDCVVCLCIRRSFYGDCRFGVTGRRRRLACRAVFDSECRQPIISVVVVLVILFVALDVVDCATGSILVLDSGRVVVVITSLISVVVITSLIFNVVVVVVFDIFVVAIVIVVVIVRL
jgi:hypothetical protein